MARIQHAILPFLRLDLRKKHMPTASKRLGRFSQFSLSQQRQFSPWLRLQGRGAERFAG